MAPSRLWVLGAALISAVGAGCYVDAEDEPAPGAKTRGDYDDVAQAVASAVALEGGGEAASLADALDLALGVMPAGFHVADDGEIIGDRGALHYGYTPSCRAGDTAVRCASIVERAAIDVIWSGDYDALRFTGAVSRCGAWSLASLQGPVATIDGDADFIFHSTVTAAGRAAQLYHLEATATYEAVAIQVDTRTTIGGTIRYAIDATPLEGDMRRRAFGIDAALTLDEAGGARLVLDDLHAYRVDTRTGVVAAE